MLVIPRLPGLTRSASNPTPSSWTRNVSPASTVTSISTRRGCRVSSDVGQRLSERRQQLAGHLRGHERVHRAIEQDPWLEAQRARRLPGQIQHFGPQALGFVEVRAFDVEDHGADLAHRGIELVDRLVDASPRLAIGDQPPGALERQPGREQALDHRVVEITGDPLLIFQPAQTLAVLAGVLELQRHAGLRGEGRDDVDAPRW